jgi:osmotically-inducible protein OsmY/sporulation protein YlmC with PRC-barrel domain
MSSSLEFKIGSRVFSRDGEVGRLKYLVVDPETETIDSLVVERGKILHKDIVVPVSWVEKADQERVVLNASLSDLETLPEFLKVEYRPLDPNSGPIAGYQPTDLLVWVGNYPHQIFVIERPQVAYHGRLGISDDEVVVRRGQPVYSSDGRRVATLDHVLVDRKTHQIKHLVVHRGQWMQRGDDIILPADAVSYITDHDIRLTVGSNELDRMERYQPALGDTQLEGIINKGLQTQPETKNRAIDVQVDRGMARLFGEVPATVASAAASIAGKVPGVIAVEDRTSRPATDDRNGRPPSPAPSADDEALAGQLREAFQRQGQEDLSGVSVKVANGVAHLGGTTRTTSGKALAEQLARTVPGVTSVTNEIVPDSVIRARVEAALAEDRRTSSIPIDVISRSGVVTLLGEVPSPKVKEAAEEIARSTPGVVAVINELGLRLVPDESDDLVPAHFQMPS